MSNGIVMCAHGGRPSTDPCPVCPALTGSERTLAKILAALDEWDRGPDDGAPAETLARESRELRAEGWFTPTCQPSERGRDLIDRARRAGVLAAIDAR